jgi:hypothetical protein
MRNFGKLAGMENNRKKRNKTSSIKRSKNSNKFVRCTGLHLDKPRERQDRYTESRISFGKGSTASGQRPNDDEARAVTEDGG